jgi:hypothetical protein
MKVMILMLIMIQKQVSIMTNKLTTTVPPKRGPNPQGLNIPSKKVTTTISEKTNGRNRQVFTKRKTNTKYS